MEEELVYPYLSYFEDIAYYFEGEAEGSHHTFAFLSPEIPTLRAWIRLSALIDDTMGLYTLSEIRDVWRHIDKITKQQWHRLSNYSVHDLKNGIYYDSNGNVQPEAFHENSYVLGLISLKRMSRERFESTLDRIISKESEMIHTPHPFRIYNFLSKDLLSSAKVLGDYNNLLLR